MELPLMLRAKILPLIYEYEVERELYGAIREYNFFDFYTTLLELRDIHAAGLIYHENLVNEINRREAETEYLDDWDDDDEVTYHDDDDYWGDAEDDESGEDDEDLTNYNDE